MLKISKGLELLFIVLALGIFSNHVSAQSLVSYHGSICQGNGKFHDNNLKIDERGAINKNSRSSIWVTCPVPVASVYNHSTDTNIILFVGNSGSVSSKVACIFDTADIDSNIITRSKSVVVPPSNVQPLEWEFLRTELVVGSIACKLPPKIGVFAYLVEFLPS